MTSLRGLNVVCVGATQGIGKAIALNLGTKLTANVTIIGRSEEEGSKVLSELRTHNPQGVHKMIKCDASSMKNIVKSCDTIKDSMDSINYLVLSQGIASLAGRQETEEGIDLKLALHYYGRIQFINCLLPLLRNSSNSETDIETKFPRVMSILSGGVHSPYTNLEDLSLKKNFSLANAANAAGFYNDLALDCLATKEKKEGFHTTFIHAAPGTIRTTWGKDFPAIIRYPLRAVQYFLPSPESCAEKMVDNGIL
eukprot:gene8775-11868_t